MALEAVFDARFVPADEQGAECNAFIAIGTPVQSGGSAPIFCYPPDDKVGRGPVIGDVLFGDCNLLDPRLCRRSLVERTAARVLDAPTEGVVLATDAQSRPLWTKQSRGEIEYVVLSAPDLREGEALRDHLVPGRFMALLPLVHFLREVARSHGPVVWHPPPLRATFVVDDPNLHWRSYGPLNFGAVAADATRFGYHLGMATIPLDVYFTSSAAARLFRERSDVLSLSIHGNDHYGAELGRTRSWTEAAGILAKALRRVERFERRTGLAVSRVMVPPHEACSQQALSLLMLLGYDAVCMTRPHPWVSLAEQSSPYATSAGDVGAGWSPAEVRHDGFPILLRRGISSVDEIALRAYLDQPLVFYAHIEDLRSGLELLRDAASEINSYPGVCWCTLGELAASNYATSRPRDNSLHVRPFARRVRIDNLDAIEELNILWPHDKDARVRLVSRARDGSADTGDHPARRTLRLTPGVTSVEATLVPAKAIDPQSIRPGRSHPTAVARRLLTETRDRALPYAGWLLG